MGQFDTGKFVRTLVRSLTVSHVVAAATPGAHRDSMGCFIFSTAG